MTALPHSVQSPCHSNRPWEYPQSLNADQCLHLTGLTAKMLLEYCQKVLSPPRWFPPWRKSTLHPTTWGMKAPFPQFGAFLKGQPSFRVSPGICSGLCWGWPQLNSPPCLVTLSSAREHHLHTDLCLPVHHSPGTQATTTLLAVPGRTSLLFRPHLLLEPAAAHRSWKNSQSWGEAMLLLIPGRWSAHSSQSHAGHTRVTSVAELLLGRGATTPLGSFFSCSFAPINPTVP